MQGYREGFIHALYGMILAQFVVIAILLGGFSNEYLSNVYFRSWVDGNYPWLGYLLQGQVEALLVGMALGGTFLVIQRIRNESRLDVTTSSGISSPSSLQFSAQTGSGPDVATLPRANGESASDVLDELEKIE